MKTLLILISLLSFQPPRWKYIVYTETLKGSTAMPSIANPDAGKTKIRPLRTYFTDSKQAHAFFDDKIRHRRNPDILDIGGETELIMKVWIDSIAIK